MLGTGTVRWVVGVLEEVLVYHIPQLRRELHEGKGCVVMVLHIVEVAKEKGETQEKRDKGSEVSKAEEAIGRRQHGSYDVVRHEARDGVWGVLQHRDGRAPCCAVGYGHRLGATLRAGLCRVSAHAQGLCFPLLQLLGSSHDLRSRIGKTRGRTVPTVLAGSVSA